MNQFTFTGKQKTFTFALMGVGVVSLLLTFFLEPGRYPAGLDPKYLHTQFWTNILHNSFLFTGISFAALLFMVTHTLAWGGWHTAFKRVPEAMMMFLPVGALLLLVVALGTAFDWHGIYLWAEDGIEQHDKLVAHKSSFLNVPFYMIAIAIILLWGFFAYMLRKLSIQEDSEKFGSTYNRRLTISAIVLPIVAFTSAYVIWQVVMAIDVHWYSTMFAWYSTASVFVAMLTCLILMLLYLKRIGYFPNVTKDHFHDLGKYLFGLSVFWTYLWFSQFMLIWYSNNGEETGYFLLRQTQFPVVFYLNLLFNFVLPFLILIMNSAKRALGLLGFMSIVIFVGHWIDLFQAIKPGVWHNVEHSYHMQHESHGDAHGKETSTYQLESTNQSAKGMLTSGGGEHTTTDKGHGEAHAEAGHKSGEAHGHSEHLGTFYLGIHFPGVLELGTLAGFLGLFLFVTFSNLAKAKLDPTNDPYLEESNHHHVV